MPRFGITSTGAGVVAAALLAVATSAQTTTFVETFDALPSEGGWTWGAGDTLVGMGGNPGAYLGTSTLATFAPRPRTTSAVNEFVGDFRARGVTSVGVDLITNFVSNTAQGRPCTLMLIYDNGTPGDFSDDSAAYFLGPNIPLPGQGWVSYDFDIPSQETELPSGWATINLGNIDDPAIHSWDEIIQNVTRVQFHYGHPEFFFFLQDWGLGMDNCRITYETPCPADLNGDGEVNGADLATLLGGWGTCPFVPPCQPGDINGDGVVDGADLAILLSQWGSCDDK